MLYLKYSIETSYFKLPTPNFKKNMIIKVLHNSRCSKSNAALDFLKNNNISFEIIDIVNDPLSETEIKTVLKKLGAQPLDIVRKNEDLYKEQFQDQNLSDDEWIKILSENPSLIQRPILVKESVAIIGRPIESVKDFVGK